MKLKVLQHHIDAADQDRDVARRVRNCPIARAFREQIVPLLPAGYAFIGVDPTWILLHRAHDSTYGAVPIVHGQGQFVVRFDTKQPVDPIEIELDLSGVIAGG
jgi:hypothetical protein